MKTPPLVLFTIGHSNREIPAFLDLLRRSGVRQVADIRRYPKSRRYPQFEKETLQYVLDVSWVAYAHMPELGGFREAAADSPHTALSGGLRGYADHTATPEFEQAVHRLLTWAKGPRTAVMCAEADPSDCHRQILSDHLSLRGVRVVHILDRERIVDHSLSSVARRDEDALVYDGGRLELGF